MGIACVAPADSQAQTVAEDALSGICGSGTHRAEGCTAIRAREVLDATRPPWSAIGRVNYAGGDTRSHCTGTLVSDFAVLTAAHCLWNPVRKRRIPTESLRFVAGYQRGQGLAVSTVRSIVLSPRIDGAAPEFSATPDHDWALLILNHPLGRRYGQIRLFRGRLRLAGPGEALMAGYAGLTPHVLSLARDCGQPLAVSGQLLAACSAMPGDSGAPLLWRGHDGLGNPGIFLLGATTAVNAGSGPFTTRFAPWFRLREAIANEKAMDE